MSPTNPDRASYFPAIEKKHGQPMAYWFHVMAEIRDRKYPEQIAYLRENHGFSQAHANALVLYSRGSTSSRRFETFEEYLAPLPAEQQVTIREIFALLQSKFPKLDLVIAWNQPMLRLGTQYVFGVSATRGYLLMAPFGPGILDEFRDRLSEYQVNKKTIRIPSDWHPDGRLLSALVKARLTQIKDAGH